MSRCGPTLNGMEAIVVLASQSPNRLKLLQQVGISNVVVRVSNFDENLPKTLPVEEFVVETARGKLHTVLEQMRANKEKYDVIIASDTVIHFKGQIIGKPVDAADAIRTLKELRGNEHAVYSGVAMHFANGDVTETLCEKTIVRFCEFPDRIVEQYVATGDPLNKAGSYGIGEFGAVLVGGIEGCFANVVGLPISRVYQLLALRNIV